MDKGIRAAARSIFVEQNEFRRKGEKFTGAEGNTQFRKEVMCMLMDQFGVSLASAATHYNDAFKFIKELNSELVSGLGRPEDKKGGRKPKTATPDAAPTAVPSEQSTATLADEPSLLLGIDAVEPHDKNEEAPPAAEAVETVVTRSTYRQAQMAGVGEAAF